MQNVAYPERLLIVTQMVPRYGPGVGDCPVPVDRLAGEHEPS